MCCQRCQVGFRIWPKTCLEFHRPVSPGEHRVELLIARSASGSVFYTLNNSMQQRNSWKANSSSTSQELACILWNRKVQRRFHNSIPPVPILSQINAVQVPNRFPRVRVYNYPPIHAKSFISLGLPQQNPIFTTPSFVLHVSPISFFFIWWVKFMKLFIIRYNLTKIILQSVADDNCDLRSTAVHFTSTVTEVSNKTFHWLIAFHP